jgi:molybdopterin-guanine dinucleotide biosynthesis protein A
MGARGTIWKPATANREAIMDEERISVLILAGGRSRRMGLDKIWMALDGVPMIERVVHRVLPVAAEILFSANASQRFLVLARTLAVPTRVVADRFPGAGPLAGIQAGLSVARCDLVLALAADMPFVNLALVRAMIHQAPGFEVVAPQTPHVGTEALNWEPLHALYRRTCLPAIEARLAAGQRQAFCFYPDVRVRAIQPVEIAACDPGLLSFYNVNTPEEWAYAQEQITSR